jgi:hypothetical protein
VIHHRRTYDVTAVASTKELAKKLATLTWCGCNGFRHGPLLILNDSFSADGAQEFAVWHEQRGVQVDSITASWMDEQKLLRCIERLLREAADATPISDAQMPSTNHGKTPCMHCR